jgi:hypothetical protein
VAEQVDDQDQEPDDDDGPETSALAPCLQSR